MPGQIIPRGPQRWLVRASLGRDERGHRRYHNHTVRGTRRDAIRYLNGVLHQQNVGTFAEPTGMSLGEYLDDWLKNSAKQRVRGRTAYEYERLLARYVRPVIGHKKVAALTPLDIQTLYSGMTERGLSARTVRYTHNVLASALKQAVRWRLPLIPQQYCTANHTRGLLRQWSHGLTRVKRESPQSSRGRHPR